MPHSAIGKSAIGALEAIIFLFMIIFESTPGEVDPKYLLK